MLSMGLDKVGNTTKGLGFGFRVSYNSKPQIPTLRALYNKAKPESAETQKAMLTSSETVGLVGDTGRHVGCWVLASPITGCKTDDDDDECYDASFGGPRPTLSREGPMS